VPVRRPLRTGRRDIITEVNYQEKTWSREIRATNTPMAATPTLESSCDEATVRVITITDDFRWLRPTPADLADLDVRIPAGFTQVPPPD
jgi:hypothetical protein